MAQTHPTPQKVAPAPRKAPRRLALVLDDPENASAVFRLLYDLGLFNQTEIAKKVGVSVSAVNEWLREPVTRPIPPRRWPALAGVWGLPGDGRTFAMPAAEVEREIKPRIKAMEQAQRDEARRAIEGLARLSMDRKRGKPGENFQVSLPFGDARGAGRHLHTVSG